MATKLLVLCMLVGCIALVSAATEMAKEDGHDHDHDHSDGIKCSDGCPNTCFCLDGMCANNSTFAEVESSCKTAKNETECLEKGERKAHDECKKPTAACFPADALVTLAAGLKRKISDLNIGDRVLSSPGVFSDVVMFTHRDPTAKSAFIELATESGVVRLTAGHYIYASGRLLPASDVRVGDFLTAADGLQVPITSVRTVTSTGLYNPQTRSGDIIVDDVVASTYTTAVEPKMAHTLLAPFRALFRAGGITVLDSVSDMF